MMPRLAAVSFVSLLFATPASAETAVAKLVAAKGQVWVQPPAGGESAAKVNQVILAGTRLRTAKDGEAEVLFEDGSTEGTACELVIRGREIVSLFKEVAKCLGPHEILDPYEQVRPDEFRNRLQRSEKPLSVRHDRVDVRSKYSQPWSGCTPEHHSKLLALSGPLAKCLDLQAHRLAGFPIQLLLQNLIALSNEIVDEIPHTCDGGRVHRETL